MTYDIEKNEKLQKAVSEEEEFRLQMIPRVNVHRLRSLLDEMDTTFRPIYSTI